MNNKDGFKINNRVEIEWEDGYYKSIIQDVNEDTIYINIPANKGKYLPLNYNDKVTVFYFHGEKIYKFRTIVTGRKIDKILLIALKKPQKMNRIQRRNFVRISLILKTYAALIDSKRDLKEICYSNKCNTEFDFFDADIVDISGGGLKLCTKKDIDFGEEIIVNIPFEKENMAVKGKIIRKQNGKEKYIYGVKFLDIDVLTREKIIKFIFSKMRKQVHSL
ncbi:flagellar protein YcgR [Clostridium sporogenes]|nr:flagellar protein YcgR [Clostridium sporogenes]MBZ1327915.1 flagellar brake domain-containing protein [Clostridium botulinum]KRU28580.1 flagellar protein YcgR [Clostridium sporogenes]KRU35203.1 flagellar protein YcgR [Clostridium sporogenes]KRU47556.1 flagellar protein YcgR [Clostridium sporogenes]